MNNFFKSFKPRVNKIVLGIIMVILILIPILHYILYNIEKDILNEQIIFTEEAFKENSWCNIMETYRLASLTAKLSALDISKDIKNDLIYNNIKITKKQNNINEDVYYSDDFLNVIYKNIEKKYLFNIDNKNNNVFVIDNNGIIFDSTHQKDSNHRRTIIDEEKNHYNKILYYDAVHKILDYTLNEDIFYEPHGSNLNNHNLLTNSNIEKIKEIFMKEGLEGLKGYVFLVPIYILNDENISIHDRNINIGDPYSLIVVQKFSLYDILNINKDSSIIKEKINKFITSSSTQKIKTLSISYSIIVFIDIIAILLLLIYGIDIKEK